MNKSYISIILSAFAACAILFSCSGSGDEPVPDPVPEPEEQNPHVMLELTDSEKDIVNKQSSFAVRMLKQLAEENSTSNFMFSPLSVYASLSILADGAQGDTRSEILSALDIDKNSLESVNTFNKEIIQKLTAADRTSKFSVANSIWIDNALRVNNDFIAATGERFGAEIFHEDLGTDVARTAINNWSGERTGGVIPELMNSRPTDGTEALLLNALCFNSPWGQVFLEKNTSADDFHNADGTLGRPQMLNGDHFWYIADRDNSNGALWPRLYMGNHAFHLLIMLPDKDVSLKDYLAKLTEEDYLALTFDNEWEYYNSYIRFPKFSISCEYDLSEAIRRLGIGKAFSSETADFSLISYDKMGISQVRQKATIGFNEKGTDKCTGKGEDVYYAHPAKDGFLIIDRPFVFMIRESWTNTILFAGCVNKL